MPEQPNILYIFSDQHRGDAMGCVGHPVIKTPNLDRLASQSVTYTQCHTNCPLCMPSRASMMTGQYVREHGIWSNDLNCNPEEVPSHVRNIRDAGYHTAQIGKTHLYTHGGANIGHSRDKIPVLNAWGFDDTHELHGPLASIRSDSPYTDYLAEKSLLKLHREKTEEYRTLWSAGKAKPWEEPACPLPTEDHLDSYTGQTTADWIRNYNGDKPFYMQVLFPGPHDPFDSPQEYRDMYDPKDMPTGILEWPQEPRPPYVDFVIRWSGLYDMTPEQQQILQTYYYSKMTLVDHYIGEILNALEESGQADNTWVIYNSDHGEMAGDHMMSHKIVFYDAAVRVPLIVRPPGGVDGWQTEALKDILDVTASMVDLANATPLENSAGESIISQVQAGPDADGAQKGKDAVISEVLGHTMVFDGKHKLAVETQSETPVELYDVENDPNEINNRFQDPDLVNVSQNLIDTHLKPIRNRLNEDKLNQWLELRAKRKPTVKVK